MSDFFGVSPKLLNFCSEQRCSLDGQYTEDEYVRISRPGDYNYVKPSWK